MLTDFFNWWKEQMRDLIPAPLRPSSGRTWRYQYIGAGAYVTGATLSYRKSFWRDHAFGDVQVGEDTKFVQSAPRGARPTPDDPRGQPGRGFHDTISRV